MPIAFAKSTDRICIRHASLSVPHQHIGSNSAQLDPAAANSDPGATAATERRADVFAVLVTVIRPSGLPCLKCWNSNCATCDVIQLLGSIHGELKRYLQGQIDVLLDLSKTSADIDLAAAVGAAFHRRIGGHWRGREQERNRNHWKSRSQKHSSYPCVAAFVFHRLAIYRERFLVSSRIGEMPFIDEFVARRNIEHFQKKLATETDEAERARLLALLTEEKAKLAEVENDPRRSEDKRG
jgi:hypothetical protein